jgi:hypothetical protein
LRQSHIGGDANGFVSILLSLHRLRDRAATSARRLLRILLLWIGPLPGDPGRARRVPGTNRRQHLIKAFSARIVFAAVPSLPVVQKCHTPSKFSGAR